MHGRTFLTVEKSTGDDWVVVATDANWETRLWWERTNSETGESEVTIEWDVGEGVEAGEYRIRQIGNYKCKDREIYH